MHQARSIGLLYAAIALAVVGVGLIIHSQTLDDPAPVLSPVGPASPVVIERTRLVYRDPPPTEVPTLTAAQLATATPAPDYRYPVVTPDGRCYWALRDGCRWQTPPPAPTGAALEAYP